MRSISPNALETLYRGKSASLYLCAPQCAKPTEIPNEMVSEHAVPIVREIQIPDAYEALLEQERVGALVIRRFHELSEAALHWIFCAEAKIIQKAGLLSHPGPKADYYRTHYPASWAAAEKGTWE